MAILQWAWLPILFLIYASYARLSGKILKIMGLHWKNCFYFSLVIMVVSMTLRGLILAAKIDVPSFLAIPLGAGSLLAPGAIFLGRSVKDENGNSIGNTNGLKITALALGLLLLTAAGLFVFSVLLQRVI